MSPILTFAIVTVLAAIALTALAWYVRQNIPLWIATLFCWVMVCPQVGVILDSLISNVRVTVFGS